MGNKALNLNGSSDYVKVNHSDSINLITGKVSYEMWFKRGRSATFEQLWDKHSELPEPVYVLIYDTNYIYAQIYSDVGGASYGYVYSTITVADTNWHHLVVVYDYDDWSNIKIYIDGVDRTGTPVTSDPGHSLVNDGHLSIGINSNLSAYPFQGSIDEARIYAKGLSLAEVQERYNSGVGLYGVLPDEDLVAGWHFDDDFFDYSGNINTVINYGATFTDGKVLKDAGSSFNGSDSYGTVANHADFDFGNGDFTLEMWVYPTSDSTPTGYQVILGRNAPSSYSPFWIVRKSSTYVALYMANTTPTWGVSSDPSGLTLPLNTWSHLVVVKDSGSVTLYVNNVADTPISADFSLYESGEPLRFGDIGAYGDGWHFPGIIDEVRVYKGRALSPTEISENYNAGYGKYGNIPDTDLVAGYHFDGNFEDYSGNEHNGTNYSITYVEARVYKDAGFSFNGSDNYVVCDEVTISIPFTFEAWILADTWPVSVAIVALGSAGGVRAGLESQGSSGKLTVWYQTSVGNYYSWATDAPPTGEWIHVMGVVSGTGSGDGIIYYNNVAQSMTYGTSGSPGATLTEHLNIGSIGLDSGTPYYVFDGVIDEVRVYSKALNSDERSANFASGKGKYGFATTNLIAGFHLDRDALDYSGEGNNGTVSGAVYVQGKVEETENPLDPPDNVIAIGESEDIFLSWDPVENATSYNIYRSEESGTGYEEIDNTNSTDYTDTSVELGITYYYVITSVNETEESEYSEEVYATSGFLPPPPGNVVADGELEHIDLSWDSAENATSYNIYRSEESGESYSKIGNTTSTDYQDNEVVEGVTYYYVIRSVKATYESANSTEVSAMAFNSPEISGVSAFGGHNLVKIVWNKCNSSPPVTQYNVYRGPSGGPYVLNGTSTGLYYYDDSVSNGVTYYYVVTGVSVEEGDYSTEISVTPSDPPDDPPINSYQLHFCGGYVNCGNGTSVQIDPNLFTVEFWFALDKIPENNEAQIFMIKNSLSLYFVYAQLSLTKYFCLHGLGSSDFNYTVDLNAGEYYHVAVTGNGTNTTLYLNGELKSSTGYTPESPVTEGDLFLGNIDDIIGGTIKVYSRLKMDEFRISHKCRTAEEILESYNKDRGLYWPTDPDLQLGFHFNEGEGISTRSYGE